MSTNSLVRKDFRAQYTYIYGVAFSYFRRHEYVRHLAEDLAQEVAWRIYAKHKQQQKHSRQYILRNCFWLVRDLLRKGQERMHIFGSNSWDAFINPDEPEAQALEMQVLSKSEPYESLDNKILAEQVINSLKQTDKSLLVNVYWQDIPQNELASSQDVSKYAINKRLSRLLKKLQSQMAASKISA